MKTLNAYITEKLVLNKDTFKKYYNYFPETKEELKDIIERLLKERKDDKVIDLNDIDTSKITDMSILFSTLNIKNIDISRWDVSNVTNMYTMFFNCINLESIGDLLNWDVSNVTDMPFMFYKCENLESIGDISKWNVSKVKNMSYMFYGCKNLKSVGDLSDWNTSNVKYMSFMFTKSGITNIPSWYKE